MQRSIKNVIVSDFAKEDLHEIIAYYQSLSQKYVDKTISAFENNIISLKSFPKKGRIIPELQQQGIENYREIIQDYYRIIYEINNDEVYIHAVIDGRRNFEDIIISKIMRRYSR